MNCKKLFLSLLCVIALMPGAFAQNWQYVGTPYIHGNNSVMTNLYFGDMEWAANGDLVVGYWEQNADLHVAKYSGGSWTSLPGAGTYAVNNVDLEVHGSDYFLGYSGIRGANMYAYVRKYDGTAWTQLGDSILLGNSGSGGWFELVLDNNGEPYILGGVSAQLADKQVHKLSGSAWTSVLTIPGSNGTVFRENSAMFNSQNHLICATTGFNLSGGIVYFNVVHEINGTTRTTLGDTLMFQVLNTRLYMDASGTPHMVFNKMPSARVLSYKLNGGAWSYTGDTSVTTGQMMGAGVTADGRAVFNTLQSNIDRSVYFFDNGTTYNIDSVNINGFAVGAIHDLLVDPATSDVYILELEVKPSAASDYAVLKHSLTGASSVAETESGEVRVYPNPSQGTVYLELKSVGAGAKYRVYNSMGMLMQEAPVRNARTAISVSGYAAGNYLVQVLEGGRVMSRQVVVY